MDSQLLRSKNISKQVANLNKEQMAKLKKAEKELDMILVAYNK